MRFNFKIGTIVAPIHQEFTLKKYGQTLELCLFHIIDFSPINVDNVLVEPVHKSKFELYNLTKDPIITSKRKLVPFWIQIGDAFIDERTGDMMIIDIIEINSKRGNSFKYEFFVSNFDKPFNSNLVLLIEDIEKYYTPTKRE